MPRVDTGAEARPARPEHRMVHANTASDACVEECGADSSSKDSERSSAAFTDYYRHQLAPLLGEPGAWAAFEEVLRSPLPVAFRFTGWDAAAHALRDAMETEHAAACLAASGRPLPWYPDRLAWQACDSCIQPATLWEPGGMASLRPYALETASSNVHLRGSSTCLARRSSERVATPRSIASGRGWCARASRGECSGRRR